MTAYNVITPSALQAGQPEDVSVVLSNLNAIASVLNGGLDNTNLSPTAGITASKLSGYPSDGSKILKGDGTWGPAFRSGDLVWSVATTRTGAVLADGTTYDGTNPTYTPLWVALGSPAPQNAFPVPDLRERVVVGHGPNTALLANDGVPVTNRHGTRHRHMPHTHNTSIPTGSRQSGSGAFDAVALNNVATASTAVDGGSGVSTDPLDGAGYVALNPFLVL